MTMSIQNKILCAVERAARPSLLERFELTILRRGDVLQEIGAPIQWVWFPEDALISVAAESIDGESLSSSTIGWNGVYGAFEACGSRQSYTRATVEISGSCWRVRAQHYRSLFGRCADLRTAIHKYVEALLVETRQLIACTAIHPVEKRLARALLDLSDRSHAGSLLSITQESLANMLGVQRSTVAVVCSALQKEGLIRTGRGRVELLARSRLEALSCPCRETIAFAQAEIFKTHTEACEALL